MQKLFLSEHETEIVARPAPEIIGRKRELSFIWRLLKGAEPRGAQTVLLAGELGVGKTRLMEEIAAWAKREGMDVLQGGASDSDGMPPYLPFLEALGHYIRRTPTERLQEQITPASQVLESIFPELSNRLGEHLEPAFILPPEQTRLRLYEAITAFIESISASHGLVLVLDDLHWADSASLDLLCYITRHLTEARLVILGAYRIGEIEHHPVLERALAELTRQRVLSIIPIGPLQPEEIEALATSLLGSGVSPQVSSLLYAQSEGNPFFAEEILRDWVERGALVQENGLWAAPVPFKNTLPSSILGVLRQRFIHLPTVVIDHLRIASVIGRTIDPTLLAALMNEEYEEVEEHLLVAERASLVKADEHGLFTFNHDKIRESLYAEVSTSRRRRLHKEIGHLLEVRYQQSTRKSPYQLAELAFHFTRSDDRVSGSHYAQLAAEEALHSSAITEALTYYRLALELLDPADSRRCVLLEGLGEAAFLADTQVEAQNALKEALTLRLQAGDREAAAGMAYKLGLVQWRRGALQDAVAAFRQALGLLENTASPLVAKLEVDLAGMLLNTIGEKAEGLAYAQRAKAHTRNLGMTTLEVAAGRVLAGTFFCTGRDILSAVQAVERWSVLAEEAGDAFEISRCRHYLVRLYYWSSAIKRASEMCSRRLALVEQIRDVYLLRTAHVWHALIATSQGKWSEAERALEHALANLPDGHTSLSFLHQVRGFLDYQREEFNAAGLELQAAQEQVEHNAYWLMFHAGLPGLIQVIEGKYEQAHKTERVLQEALDRFPERTVVQAPALLCMALMAVVTGDGERASQLYPKLLDFAGQHYWFLVDRVLGLLAASTGDWERAEAHLAVAEETARREGLLPELARVLHAQADLELARSSQGIECRATDLLEQALVIFEDLGMQRSVQKARSQLQALVQHSSAVDTPARALPAGLSEREAEVLVLVAEGKSNRQIATELHLSEKTVANHLSHIFSKTRTENRVAAAAFAFQHRLV